MWRLRAMDTNKHTPVTGSAEQYQKHDALIHADNGFSGSDSTHVYFGMCMEMSKRFTLTEMQEIVTESRRRVRDSIPK
jgi:hypothetical protein